MVFLDGKALFYFDRWCHSMMIVSLLFCGNMNWFLREMLIDCSTIELFLIFGCCLTEA